MKQYITIEQLEELNSEQLVKLNGLVSNPHLQRIAHPEYHTSDKQDWVEATCRINIGIMIEILEIQTHYTQQIINEDGRYTISINIKACNTTGWATEYYNELCEALWEAVKHILRGDK